MEPYNFAIASFANYFGFADIIQLVSQVRMINSHVDSTFWSLCLMVSYHQVIFCFIIDMYKWHPF